MKRTRRCSSMTRYAENKLRRVAHHEAGHAVAAVILGHPFKSVTVVPKRDGDGWALGRVTLTGEWPHFKDAKEERDYVARNIQMSLAGPVAETLHTRCWVEAPMNEFDDEYMAFMVAEILYPLGRQRRNNFVDRLRFQTLELLQQPGVWAAVEAVADRLIRRKRLSAADVRKLVQRRGNSMTKGAGRVAR